MKNDVTAIGPLNVDILIRGEAPEDLGALRSWEGPAAMELAVAGSVGYAIQDMAKLGLRVSVSANVAGDVFGPVIVRQLRESGVDANDVRVVEGARTGIGAYVLAFGSPKRPLFYQLPTHDPWPQRYDAGERETLLDTRSLHSGGFLHFAQMYDSDIVELYEEAHRRGIFTSVDSQFPLREAPPPWMASMRRILPALDFLFCDEREALGLTGAVDLPLAAVSLLETGVRAVIIKRGEAGSDIYEKDQHFHQPGVKIGELVDSIGAGDAFDAGFLAAFLEGKGLKECARFASIVAACTVTAPGGCRGMPDRKTAFEIEARLSGRH